MRSGTLLARALVLGMAIAGTLCRGADPRWAVVSTLYGDLFLPGSSTHQADVLVADLNHDKLNDVVVAMKGIGPSIVSYMRLPNGWRRDVIEPNTLPIETGGVAVDVDGDGDLDLVFGGDETSNQMWWWENPSPDIRSDRPWKRHLIKSGGKPLHHDILFGDFKGLGKPQMVFWNQGARTLFIAEIPANPNSDQVWQHTAIFNADDSSSPVIIEGLASADLDGDGRPDIIAGNYWFKYAGDGKFRAIRYSLVGGRVVVGRFQPGAVPQIVTSPGKGTGRLRIHICKGNPEDPNAWNARNLYTRDLSYAHTLQAVDINGDGYLDLFTAEMYKWSDKGREADNPNARAIFLYGDGRGNFRASELMMPVEVHQGRIADLDGDGDMDLVCKPYFWGAPRLEFWLQNGIGPRVISTAKPYRGPIGADLASFGDAFGTDTGGTLAQIRKLGLREVELPGLAGKTAAQWRKALDAVGIKCGSVVFPEARFMNDLDGIAKDAAALGTSFVVCDGVLSKWAGKREDLARVSAALNDWAVRLKPARITLVVRAGRPLFKKAGREALLDELALQTKPGGITFELDMVGAVLEGVSPQMVVQRYKGRITQVIANDIPKKGISTKDSESKPAVVPLGSGGFDIPAFLKETARAGVRSVYLSHASGDPAREMAVSIAFLKEEQF